MKLERILIIVLPVILFSCNKLPVEYPENVDYTEIQSELITSCFPCLYGNITIKNRRQFDSLRNRFAKFDEIEYFIGDGTTNVFRLSFEPLDADYDGKIDPNDLKIYCNWQILVDYEGKTYGVFGYPIHFGMEDEIIVYDIDKDYSVTSKIPSELVLTVDTINGQVSFIKTPHNGALIGLSGKKLVDSIGDFDCSLKNFSFENRIIIGNEYCTNNCVLDVKIDLYKYNESKSLSYDYSYITEDNCTVNEDSISTFFKWIIIENIDETFNIGIRAGNNCE